jgi:hypothetical protein
MEIHLELSITDRILSGLKTVVLIEERVTILSATVKELKGAAEAKLADHESRLTRRETVIEIAKPDGSALRITPPAEVPKGVRP